MSGRFFLSGMIPFYEGAAQALSTFTFYLTGTTTPEATYSDAGLTAANTNPVVTDANGYLGEVFLTRNRYKVVWKNAAGTTLKTWDPVDKDKIHTRGAGLPSDPHPGQIHDNTSDGHRYERKIGSAAWSDLGTTDSVANTASVTEVLAGTETAKYVTPDALAALWQRGTDIASATTLSLPSTGGEVFNVTGTTTITAISAAQGGRRVRLRFASALQLTHNGTSFILYGSANIAVAAGDWAEFTNEAATDASGSNWRMSDFGRATGSPINITDLVATQAQQETGSSTAVIVTPGRQHYHISAAKAIARYDSSSGSHVVTSAHSTNVSSVSDNGTGDGTINITTAFSTAGFAFVGGAGNDEASKTFVMTQRTTAPTTTALRMCSDHTGTGLIDVKHACVVMFGDQ